MLYRAVHITDYTYQDPVAQCISEAHLTPRKFPGQTVHESEILVEPTPRSRETRIDYFGNQVLVFSILESHDRLKVISESIVELDPVARPAPPAIPWEEARTALSLYRDAETREAYEFAFDSPFVTAAPQLAAFGADCFQPGRALAEAAVDLSRKIYTEFRYRPRSTSIDMPLLEVLKSRQGVCQDFSHVLIGVLRSYRLAARYVSGYLRSGAKYQGAEASHAWVSVFIPDFGWLDLDPTNNMIPRDGHVTVAWGRDYGDVTPVKGVSLGGGTQSVDVSVRVEPLELEAEPGAENRTKNSVSQADQLG